MEKINSLYLNRQTIQYLNSKGIEHLEELEQLTLDELEENISYSDIRSLRNQLHSKCLTLKGEYEGINLTSEQLEVLISTLELDNSVEKILKRAGINTLGDLLTTDYSYILRCRGLGEYKMELLKQYVHSLGCNLRHEEKSLNVQLRELKEQGIRLLEEDLLDPKLYMPLYRNGIYTLNDLIKAGSKVLEIPNYGPLRKSLLLEQLKELGIELVVECNDVSDLIEGVRIENNEIRARIASKEAMLLEYDELLREKAELIKREEEIDRLIESKLKELGGKGYVKKQGNS